MGTTYDTYDQLMADFPDAILVHDGQTILYANDEALRLSGLGTRSELEGRSILAFVPKDFLSRVKQRISQVTTEQRSTELLRERIRLPGGNELHVEIKTMPIEFDGKAAIQLVARDCTERVKTEAALVASEQRFRALVNDMNVGVVVHNSSVEILQANPTALELLGLSEDQVLGRTSVDPMWNVIHEDGSPFPGAQHPAPVALATGAPVLNTIMGVYHPVARSRRWLSVDAIPQYNSSRQEQQVLVTFVDVTERRNAQDALLREVHHRIKNNMTVLKGLLVLQADSVAGSSAEPPLRDAESRLMAMMVLYDKLYRSGEPGALSAKGYLPMLVKEILANFSVEETKNVTVEVEDVPLSASRLQSLGLIVNELLTNVHKYAFAGRPYGKVSVTLKADGDHLRLVVADDGVGFPEGVDFEHSTGFGLSLVAMLAKGLRANLQLERSHGTTVVLDFPYEAANSANFA
ncbi:MAG: PAS domain S-box protein [Spirochaetales bacterium]